MINALALTIALLQLSAGPEAVLTPGLEGALLKVMTPEAGELPASWELRAIEVEPEEIRAIFGKEDTQEARCDTSELCVRLRYPEPKRSAIAFFAFTLSGKDLNAAPDLIAGIKERLPRLIKKDPWKRLSPPPVEEREAPLLPPNESAFKALLSPDGELLERVLDVDLSPDEARLRIRTDDGPELLVHLVDRPAHLSNPQETTRSFHVRFEGGVVTPADLPARVMAALRTSDKGDLRLNAAPTFEDHSATKLHGVLWALALLLTGLMVLITPMLLSASLRVLGREPLTWGIIALGVVIRLFLPGRMIEFGIGYMLVDYAEYLIMPRYGPSVPMLHHGLFTLFGADHSVVINAHRIMGCLMLPMACAGGVALAKLHGLHRPAFTPLWAAGLAFTPMLMRAEATESNLQPALFAFWLGLVAWLALRGSMRILATAVGLGFAMLARPELVVVVPIAWLLLCHPWKTHKGAMWITIALLSALAPWQLSHVFARTAWELGESSLAFDGAFFNYHLWAHLAETALIEPRLAPLGTTLLGIFALMTGQGRGFLWALALGGLAWIAVYAVDLSSASAPRLHVAGLQAWTLLAALGLARLTAKRPKALVALCLVWVISAGATLPWLWATTNEDTEARLLERLEESAKGYASPPLIATLHAADEPEEKGHGTHRYFPTYRFTSDSIIPLGRIAEHLGKTRPLLYYQGVNCYASLDRDERGDSGLLQACKGVHERLELEPLWVEDVVNYANPRFQELGYYGPEETLRVGLWRVRGP